MPSASAGRDVIIANASPQRTPVAPGTSLQRDQVAGILTFVEQVARVIVVDHADRDLHAGSAHPADVRLRRRDLFEARRQIVDRRGDDRDPRGRNLVRDEPAFATRRRERSSATGYSRLSSRTLRMSRARSTWTSRYCRPCKHRHERRRVEARQQDVLAALRARPI